MLSPKKLLENARNRIAKRENWTTGQFASDPYGSRVEPINPAACQWCAIGSVLAEAGIDLKDFHDYDGKTLNETMDKNPNLRDAIAALADEAPLEPSPGYDDSTALYNPVWRTNDHYGHEKTLEMFDGAIQNMKGE